MHVIYGVLSSRPINCVHIRSYVLEYERIQFFAQLLSFYVSCLLTSTFLLGSLDVMSLFSLLADESGGVLPINFVKTSAMYFHYCIACMSGYYCYVRNISMNSCGL